MNDSVAIDRPNTDAALARYVARPFGRLDRQILRQEGGAVRRLARRRPRRGARPARPQRRRQDHLLLFDHGPGEARQRPHPARRPGHYRPAHVPPRHPRHRLSAAGDLDLPRPHRLPEHHGGARGRRARQEGARRSGSSNCSANSISSSCATRRPWRCPAASGGAARSPARSPPIPRSCCSTSPSPASTRSRSRTFAT